MAPEPDARELLSTGLALIRARPGFYVSAYAVCVLPTMLLSAASVALQADAMRAVFVSLVQGQPPPIPAPNAGATAAQWLSYLAMWAGMPAFAAIATRGALDQLDGGARGVLATLRACGRPILWMAGLDAALAFLNYVGCFCCLVPGIAIAGLVVAYLSLQTPILCDRPVDWVVAASESRTLSRPHVGTLLSATALYGLFWVGLVLALAVVAVGGFVAIAGTDTLAPAALLRGATIAYGGALVLALVPQAVLTALWFTFRAVLYHRLTRAQPAPQLASVFA